MIEELDPHITPQLDHSALLVIDTQVDFVDDGTFPVPGTTQVVPAITRLIRAYRTAQLPIVHAIRLYDGADVLLGGECQAPAGQEWAMWKPRWAHFTARRSTTTYAAPRCLPEGLRAEIEIPTHPGCRRQHTLTVRTCPARLSLCESNGDGDVPGGEDPLAVEPQRYTGRQ